MINKNEVSIKSACLKKIANKYNFKNIEEELNLINKEIEEFKIRVLFIGSFSAGKSALINSYLSDDNMLLCENQSPETAIATEIVYGESEKIILRSNDNSEKTVNFDEIENINSEDYFNYRYIVNNNRLKELSDYIIVDTPGFDSGIERHNKALFQYIGKGTVYILVIDCEKGTISESAMNFIKEVTSYDAEFAVILNKCDKKSEDDVIKIKNNIKDIISLFYGNKVNIVSTSKYDFDVSEKIKKIVTDFNAQKIFNNKYDKKMNEIKIKLLEGLYEIKKSLDLNLSEYDREIKNRENIKKDLLEKIKHESTKLKEKLYGEVKNNIIYDSRSALINNSYSLAVAYTKDVELFKEKIISILRPILISSMQKHSSEAYLDFIDDFNFDIVNIDDKFDDISQIILGIGQKVKNLGDIATKFDGAYKSIAATLAITTSVVAPWIEMILFFLPEILKAFGMFNQKNQLNKIQNEIESNIIPQIIRNLEMNITQSLSTIEEQMIENLKETFEEVIDIETSAITEVKEKRKSKQEDFNKYVQELEKDIEELKSFSI